MSGDARVFIYINPENELIGQKNWLKFFFVKSLQQSEVDNFLVTYILIIL